MEAFCISKPSSDRVYTCEINRASVIFLEITVEQITKLFLENHLASKQLTKV